MNNPINYTARIDAAEGKLFYDNLLNNAQYVKKYFPASPGETSEEYIRRPKIAVPITSSIVDRIVNILNFKTVITANNKEAQDKLDTVSISVKLSEFIRDVMVNTLNTGNNLSVLRIVDRKVSLENWDGTYVWMNGDLSGYEYTLRDDLIVPVLSPEVKEDKIVRVIIDEYVFGNIAHGLPFTPSVLTKNVDKYEDGWGKSYPMRYADLIVEYNHIISQISKSIKVLQNVWVTNRDVDNPENPIRLSPDRINFLGVDGTLEQAIRNLNLKEEKDYLDILEHQISRASQVPAELAGLKDVGKLPSGIALQILLQPLVELIERLRTIFNPMIEQLALKLVLMQYIAEGKTPPSNLETTVQTNQSIFPEDRTAIINEVILLKKEGLINDEQARLLLEPIIGLDLKGQAT
jgi:hypothetical protein